MWYSLATLFFLPVELVTITELTGRFLHITDFHPDPHYLTGSTLKSGCHRLPDPDNDLLSTSYTTNSQLSKKRTGTDTFLAGKWGTSNSDCDTPLSLVNITLDWLNEEWKDEIDFVVWTGDSARHDIDREIPRTPGEIYELNRMMVRKMRETFGADMPVIPSMGELWVLTGKFRCWALLNDCRCLSVC